MRDQPHPPSQRKEKRNTHTHTQTVGVNAPVHRDAMETRSLT